MTPIGGMPSSRGLSSKGQRLAPYLSKVRELLLGFEYYDISHIPREHNTEADSLAKFASTGDAQQLGLVPVEVIHSLSIEDMEIDMIAEVEVEQESWITPIKQYLLRGTLPESRNERRQIIRKASRYVIQGDVMYRKGFSMPFLRCIAHDEIKRVLREVHEGESSGHTGG